MTFNRGRLTRSPVVFFPDRKDVGTYRLLEHTADMGIEATGADPAELFTAAAEGLRAILSDAPIRPCTSWQEVAVRGQDREELLINWLNTILFRLEVDGLFPERFRIETISATRLTARIGGVLLDGSILLPDREVKAATWHQLEIVREEEGWRARLYLDL
jgi:protein archease